MAIKRNPNTGLWALLVWMDGQNQIIAEDEDYNYLMRAAIEFACSAKLR